MFLELTLFDDDAKILFNINRINCIFQIKGVTNVYVGEVVYRVRESYEKIVETIDKYGNLPKVREVNADADSD